MELIKVQTQKYWVICIGLLWVVHLGITQANNLHDLDAKSNILLMGLRTWENTGAIYVFYNKFCPYSLKYIFDGLYPCKRDANSRQVPMIIPYNL